ncbi:hypothetical protein C7H84_33940 [Burkholderia sp. Nafp2/4-1b]|uniref:Kelch repeat-containing protein n=1 Tax=Burkholderia sp. Nafp2/4-1b TaxID=2116686 RepID=UPI000EF90E22|nr:kelch repeat-containing protein [Burkholderia sp. Nafp2/4-1b]RKT98981.1 hypothetical protein C7H84_33940 [Burkholderia sp. Nafp2/4-1b]
MSTNQTKRYRVVLRPLSVIVFSVAAICASVLANAEGDGGCDYGGPNVIDTGGNVGGQCTNATNIYVLGSNGWKKGPPMDHARCGLTLARAGAAGLIYAIGGYDNSGAAVPYVEAYDEKAMTWKSVASLPEPLADFAAVSWDGLIYVFGGTSQRNNASKASTSVYVYDPSDDTWVSGGILPAPVWYGRAAVGPDDYIYLVGGKDNYGKDLGTTLRFDPILEEWAPLPYTLNVPRSGFGIAMAGDNKIYVLGGQSGSSALASIESFDPADTAGWQTSSASLLFPTAAIASTVMQTGNIMAPGGIHSLSQSGGSKDVQEIDLLPTGKPHTVTLYMHGPESSPDYGGLIMNQTAPKTASAPFQLNILSSQSWYSMPSFNGTLNSNSSVTVSIPCSLGVGLLSWVTLSAVSATGSGAARTLGGASIPVGACLGLPSVDVNIPISGVSAGVQLQNEELGITLSTVASALLTLSPKNPMKVTIAGYSGMPGPSAGIVVKSDPSVP